MLLLCAATLLACVTPAACTPRGQHLGGQWPEQIPRSEYSKDMLDGQPAMQLPAVAAAAAARQQSRRSLQGA